MKKNNNVPQLHIRYPKSSEQLEHSAVLPFLDRSPLYPGAYRNRSPSLSRGRQLLLSIHLSVDNIHGYITKSSFQILLKLNFITPCMG